MTDSELDLVSRLAILIEEDAARMDCLRAVQVLPGAEAAIGAGFVRNAVWDHLSGVTTPLADVDVVWFDRAGLPERDRVLEGHLRSVLPAIPWSVKNQARMHERNGDRPYHDLGDALWHWPETATAVAVRLDVAGDVQVLAPHGLHDLFDRRVRPTPHMASRADRRAAYAGRCLSKRWEQRWPGVTVEHATL